MTSLLIMSLAVTGCSAKDSGDKKQEETSANITVTPSPEPTKEVEATPTVEIEQKEDVEYSAEELKVLSEELTTQILDGDFTGVSDRMEDSIKQSYPADVLKKAFDDAVKPLGAFVTIESSLSQETEDAIYVGVLLRYEGNGLQVLYGYNSDIKLSTFRINYVTLEEDTSGMEHELYREIEIKVGEGEYLMDGIMTIPEGIDKPPVVIFVQGSGQSDMDETSGACSNKPFRDLAQGLAENKIASIRYNKRYYQYTDSIPDNITVYDEILDDVGAAILLAQQSEELDTSRIYVIGHSEGGMLSPKIAQDHPELAGIISLAGSPRHLEDIIYDQAVYFTQLDETASEDEKQQYLDMMKASVEEVKNLTEDNLATPILGITGYYWKSLNHIDTATIVQQLNLPMLFLQGTADFQVYADVDFLEWQTLLKDHENATFIEYEGLNHLFMPTTGAKDTTDYDSKNSVDAKVINDIAQWINKN